MKPYILRTEKAVEPQKASRHRAPNPLRPPPAAPAPAGPALFIGLDVHNASIAVSLAPSDKTEVRRYGIIGGTLDDVLRLSKKLAAAHPGRVLKFCYEAGPRGYPLCRFLRAHGTDCIIVSPSKVLRAPGNRVKTDRRDADQLARLLRAGELTGIYVPDAQDEAVRDLIRARHQVQRQRHPSPTSNGNQGIGLGSISIFLHRFEVHPRQGADDFEMAQFLSANVHQKILARNIFTIQPLDRVLHCCREFTVSPTESLQQHVAKMRIRGSDPHRIH